MKRLSIELGRAHTAVRGRDAYTLLVAVGARPIWSPISRAWMAQRYQGHDVIALAEARGYVTDVREAA